MKIILIIINVLLVQISFAQNSDWVQVNPNPQNDFYAIKFFNQNTGYVVGSGGVILKNTTGSNNWTSIPSGTVNDLYGMYFFNVNTGYVVGGGGLIMYTSDGGGTWTHLVTSNGNNLRSITFVNQNTGFICGDHGELYRTTTGLYGWVLSSVTTKNLYTIAAPDSIHVYACGDSSVFIRSTNGGVTWSSQIVGTYPVIYRGMCFTGPLTGHLAANQSGSLKTTDGGVTWSTFNGSYSWLSSSIKFMNNDTGFACTLNGPLMKTTNAGANWFTWGSGNLQPGNYFFDICVYDTGSIYTCGYRGTILRSKDSSFLGITHSIGGSRFPLSYVSFINANTGAVLSGSVYMYTTNGGSKWSLNLYGSNSWFEGGSSVTSMKLIPPNSGYLTMHGVVPTYYEDYFINTTDGGLTWNGNRALSIPLSFGFPDYCEAGGTTFVLIGSSSVTKNSGTGWTTILQASNMYCLSFANSNTGIVGINDTVHKVNRTTDGGATWTFVPTGNNHTIRKALLRSTGTGFIAGDSSFVMRTYDYGANWTLLSQNGNQYIQNIYFATDNTGWYMGQTGNYPNYTGRLFYTNNGGTNFQQLQSLMSFNVRGFSFIDENTGYVCGDSGIVLKTTNGGLTFVNPTIENLPKEFSLSQNYPNPFNPTTTISFAIPVKRQTSEVKLIIYDITGKEIATLINQQMQPGNYSVNWDATNFPSGVYFYQLSINNEQLASKKMVLLK